MSRLTDANDPQPLCRAARRAVVTGGAGFIGSHLVEILLAEGIEVLVVDDLSTGSRANLAPAMARSRRSGVNCELEVASCAEPATAARAVAGADIVFHLAGIVGVRKLARQPLDVMQANLHSTQAMLAAAAAGSVPILITSSSEVYGDGPVPFVENTPVQPGATEGLRGGYACAKAMGEWLAMAHRVDSNLPVLVARLFNTVGPRQSGSDGMVLPRFVRQALHGEPLTVYGEGRQTRCFAHVRDIARALFELSRSSCVPGPVVNVGSDIETSVGDLAQLVCEVAGSGSELRTVPFHEIFPPGFLDPPRRVPDLERLRTAIGWVPSTSLADIVRDQVAWARASMAAAVRPSAAADAS
ncbi:MAG: NAD-dependent epimerase/dehydratase family protein [Planctomycetota bacterium]